MVESLAFGQKGRATPAGSQQEHNQRTVATGKDLDVLMEATPKGVDLTAVRIHILQVGHDTLRRRIAAAKLPASRFGVRLIRVRIEDLDRLYRPIPNGDELARWRR